MERGDRTRSALRPANLRTMSGLSEEDEQRARELAEGVLAGDRTMLARAITAVESTRPRDAAVAQSILARVLPHTGDAHRVGISGVPGAGKSTLIEALGTRLCEAGRRVAVLAVDPSSTLSGGSITVRDWGPAPPARRR